MSQPPCEPGIVNEQERRWVARFDDGSKLLLTVWITESDEEHLEVAVRRSGDRTWSPPAELSEAP